mmetsp:Transcript_27881/g.83337  ORF Transcript_27881/g.83337 Transcript_27881/m.83337 type:complete len:687 (+) Transcript_27881:41-2101(+)
MGGGQEQVWEVVGGEGKGGILVRQGKETTSPKEEERLSTGARVREVTLEDGRLQYQLLTGGGPQSGWVSVKLGDKDLVVKCSAESGEEADLEPSDPGAPKALRPHREVAPKFAPCGHLDAFKPNPNVKKFKESCAQRLPGNLYGLNLPRTPEELGSEHFGPKWLTEAFHKAGTLPRGNSIKAIVDGRRFEGGGSGPKVLFKVEYEKPDENLDTTLFGKFPWTLEENQQQKVVEQGQGKFGDNWGGEINFYRFISPHVTFPVPKLYFGDLNRESAEAIIINAAVAWPEDGKTEFAPYEVMPPCGKCEDYLLKDPHEYYFTMMRRQGTLAGLGKTNKLGPDAAKVKWYDYNPKIDVFCAFAMPGHEQALRKLVDEAAPHIFPEVVRSAEFLDRFEAQMAEICKASESIAQYIYADVLYTGFQHQNGNTDNAYFYRRADGELDCGLLDWGSFAHMAFASAFQGSFVSCLGNMLAEHDDRLICAWADAYHETGAPPLDVNELLMQYRMVSAVSCYGCIATARGFLTPQMKPLWDNVKAYNDELITQNFGMKFGVSMLYHRVLLWALRGDVYWASYQEWVKRGKVGPAKAAENAAAAEEHARLLKLSVRELKEQIAEVGLSAAGATEKEELVRLLEKGRARQSASKGSFVPTETWQAVPTGAAIPAGLEVKFDLAKGCNYARLPPGRAKKP